MITFLTVIIVLILFFIVYRFLRFSSTGLTVLREKFLVTDQPEGDTFIRQTIRVGELYYRNCVRITITSRGLYIAVSIPFPWSKGERMMIPWDMLSQESVSGLFLWKVVKLNVAGEEMISIWIPDYIGKNLPIG